MMVFLIASPALAILNENLKILTREEIQKLSDETLMETYIEARIEEKASSEFHHSAGFGTTKDYDQYKELLRYLFELRREMGMRKEINADSVDKYME
jgi:hypothetical protein